MITVENNKFLIKTKYMEKIRRKIQLSTSKKSYELLISENDGPFKVSKTGLTLDQALKESANLGYKNLWIDIVKKK